jgi:VWFA-related protein
MKRAIIAVILSGIMSVPAFPQQAPQQPPQQPPQPQQQLNTPLPAVPKGVTRFGTTTQLVVVDVTVKDKSGAPIKGLKPTDFALTEDGKKQDIKVFQYQELEETVMPEAVPAIKQPVVAKADEGNAAPAAPVVKSLTANQIAPSKPGEIKYKDRRLLVMFFDMTSMSIQDQVRAQSAAQKFLKSQMTVSDLMAIMTNTTDLKVVQDFTDDRDSLAKTIKGLTIGEGADLAVEGATGADNEEDTGAAYTADDTEFNIFNTDRKLAALQSATKMLGSLSEKKALVYFTSGVSKTGVDNDAQLRATVNSALRNNVVFYPIDARGLQASAPLGDATKASPGGAGMYSGSSARSQQGQQQGSQDTLSTLAADTGGKALLDNNDLGLGIQQAQKDISSYYILGYYSENSKMDGHYRRIKLGFVNNELQARAGKLDYRQGYFAGKEFKQFNASDKENQLVEALMMGDPVTDISVALEVDYFRMARDRYFVPITVKIPGSELELAKHGGAESTKLDFIGEVRDAKGQVQGNVRDSQDIKLKGETASQLSKRTLAYDTGFTLIPGTYTLKFLTRENTTGKMGTFETRFVVPDLTLQVKYLPISSVVLSNQRQPLNESLASAERDKRILAQNPLVQDQTKLVPSVTRVFSRNRELYVFLQAYERAEATAQPLVAYVTLYRGETRALETAPLAVTVEPDARRLLQIDRLYRLELDDGRAGQVVVEVLGVVNEVRVDA